MNSDGPEIDDIPLLWASESQLAWLHRCSVIVVAGVALLAAGLFTLPMEWFPWAVSFLLVGLFGIGNRLRHRKQLVLRRNDFFTIGGDANQRIPWRSVTDITFGPKRIELALKSGSRTSLRLDFLDRNDRHATATALVRLWEVFRSEGPFEFPARDEVEIRTPRLKIGPASPADREFCLSLVASEEVRADQCDPFTSPEWESRYFDLMLASMRSSAIYWKCVIRLEDDTPIGSIVLGLNCPILRQAQLAIDLRPEYWNQGYGSEAVEGMLDFARQRTNLSKVSAGCFADNIRCARMLEKAGMVRMGTFERFWFKDGEWKAGHHFESVL